MLDFTSIDFETANAFRGSPCAVGLVKVRGGAIVEEERILMRPPAGHDEFHPFNVSIHGITAEAVADRPRWEAVLPDIAEFIGGDDLVAHNAAFDIGVLARACQAAGIAAPELSFWCTIVLARRLLQLPSYRLPFVTEALGLTMGEHHDPLADARAAAGIVRAFADEQGAATLADLGASLQVRRGSLRAGGLRGTAHSAPGGTAALKRPEIAQTADPDGPLFGRTVVFTGALSSMTRQQAWEACAAVGATPEASTTKRTNVLVIGTTHPASLRPGAALSSKAAKAFSLQAAGQDIEVMTEDDFLRCLDS